MCALLFLAAFPVDQGHGRGTGIERGLAIVLVASLTWLVVRTATAVRESGFHRYAAVSQDPAGGRRVRTQVALIQRVAFAAVAVVGGAIVLVQFPAIRTVGTSALASAGVIAAVAAQSVGCAANTPARCAA